MNYPSVTPPDYGDPCDPGEVVEFEGEFYCYDCAPGLRPDDKRTVHTEGDELDDGYLTEPPKCCECGRDLGLTIPPDPDADEE